MKPRRELPPIGEVVAALAARAESLCHELLPGGRRDGHEWTVPGDASPFGCSMAVHIGGKRSGVWAAWAAGGDRKTGTAGDALDLVAQLRCDGDKGKALAWARGWLGIADDVTGGETPARRRAPPQPATDQDDDEEARKARAAHAIWLHPPAGLAGTPAELYLRRRGIDLMAPPFHGRAPGALRFHPALFNTRTGRAWPALVALISRAGRPVAVHRTWLTEDGQKAPIFDADGKSQAKHTFGNYRGGYIAVFRGLTPEGRLRPPMAKAAAGEAVWITEGIEDALAMAVLTRGADRVIAAVSLANMGAIILPPAITTVTIAAQNDPFWHAGQDRPHPTSRGLDRAIRHFQDEGREVRVWRPELTSGCKDANDYLRWLQQHHGEEAA